MADAGRGEDVDVVCDIHDLPGAWEGRFGAFLALSVFEHLERPWIAAQQIARVLKPGGLCYVATHQSFPLHGFPNDFFRFSADALEVIFEDAACSSTRWGTRIAAPSSRRRTRCRAG